MQLLRPENVATPLVRHTFGRNPWPVVLLFVVFAVAPLFPAALLVGFLRNAGTGVRVAAGILAIVPVVLYAMIVSSLARAALDAFSRDNWTMKVASDGVYIKFRSFMNRHFAPETATIAWVPFAEIESAGERVERITTEWERERPVTRTLKWVEIRLTHRDTEELRAAIAAEMARKGPDAKWAGIRHRRRAGHSPVLVPEPGVITVERCGNAMLTSIAERVRSHEPTAASFGQEAVDGLTLEARALRLAARGDAIAATAMVRREMGLSASEAKQWVRHAMEKDAVVS